MLTQYDVAITTDGSGGATVYSPYGVTGRIHAIKFDCANLANNFDVAVTGETSGVPILVDATVAGTAVDWYYPRALPSKNTDGEDFANCTADIHVVDERIKTVITNGDAGAAVTGTVTFFVDRAV